MNFKPRWDANLEVSNSEHNDHSKAQKCSQNHNHHERADTLFWPYVWFGHFGSFRGKRITSAFPKNEP